MPNPDTFPIDFRTPRFSSLQGNVIPDIIALQDQDQEVWVMKKDVDGKIYGRIKTPEIIGGIPNAQVILVICANNVAAVATRLSIAVKPVADGETFDPATLNDIAAQDITMPTTAYQRKDVTFTLPTTGGDFPIEAGDILEIEVFHEGTHPNDLLAADTLLIEGYLKVDLT